MIRRSLMWWVAGSIALIAAGCTTPWTPPKSATPGASGSLVVQALLPEEFTAASVVESLELIMIQDGQRRNMRVPIESGRASVQTNGLSVGEWELALRLQDDDGDVTHSASTQVLIFPDQVTAAELTLTPEPGILEVIIDLGHMAGADRVERARVHVQPGGYNSGERDQETGLITTSRSLPPRTYDYRVALYGAGYLVADLIYNSPWAPVTIEPGKVRRIVWTPSSGELDLIGHILHPPSMPPDFSAIHVGDGLIELRWGRSLAFGGEEPGYRIYERSHPFGAFSIVDELPPGETEWTTLFPLTSTPQTVAYAVAAFRSDGYESARTQAQTLFLPPAAE